MLLFFFKKKSSRAITHQGNGLLPGCVCTSRKRKRSDYHITMSYRPKASYDYPQSNERRKHITMDVQDDDIIGKER